MPRNLAGKCSFGLLFVVLLAAIGCGSVSGNSPSPTPTPGAGNPPPTPTPGNPAPTPTPSPSPTPTTTSTLVFVGGTVSGGITVFKLASDGSLTQVQGDIPSANTLPSAIAQSGTLLVAAQPNQNTGLGQGQLHLFSINGQTGAISLKASATLPVTGGSSFGEYSAAMNDEFAYIGTQNGIYGFSVANGELTPIPGSPFQTLAAPDDFKLSTYGFLSINGSFLMAAHGSNSAVQSLRIGADGALTPVNNSTNGGSFTGMVLSPAGTQVYASFSGHLITLPFNTGDGSFGALVDTIATNQFQGNFEGRIAVSPSGNFLYENFDQQPGINIYSVNQQSGKFTFVNQASAEDQGKGIAIDPSGKFIVAVVGDDAGQHTLVYSVNPSTGGLTLLPGRHDITSQISPTDVVIASF